MARRLSKKARLGACAAAGSVVLGIATGGWVWMHRKPHTISEALRMPELQSSSQRVPHPLGSQSLLGHLVQTEDEGGYVSVHPTACFLPRAMQTEGLKSVAIDYDDASSFAFEIGSFFGLDSKAVAKGRVTLAALERRTAIGIPLPNGPCDFAARPTWRIVTSEIMAGTITTDVTRKHTDVASTSADGGANSKGSVEENRSDLLAGNNIIIGATSTDVTVTIHDEVTRLTNAEIVSGKTVSVKTADFGVSVKDEDVAVDGEHEGITLRIQGATYASSPLPITTGNEKGGADQPRYRTCTSTTDELLTSGDRCYVWLSDNAGAAVWWDRHDAQGVDLTVRIYKAMLSNPGPGTPAPR